MKVNYSNPLFGYCSLLLLLAAPHTWACGNSSSTLTPLPGLEGAGTRVSALNAAGKIAGVYYVPGSYDTRAILLDNTQWVELGTLGGNVSEGYTINTSGAIAGESSLSGEVAIHAFLYSDGIIKDIGTLGGTYSAAYALNDSGWVVGMSDSPDNTSTLAFLYANGSMQSLGTLGGTYSAAWAINAGGMVVGESSLADESLHAFAYSGNTMTDLGTLGGTYSSAFGLNNTGVVIGESSLANEQVHAFAYSGGTMIDLGTLGGTSSTPIAINENGDVLGSSTTTDDAATHAFIYRGQALIDLGTLGGSHSYGYSLNNRAQVVGQAETADGSLHAFLWEDGKMVDLNTLLPQDSGWELVGAQFINDAGRIVGYGNFQGLSQWFILDLASGNNPPVAVATPEQVVECQGTAILDGSRSTDPDGDKLSYVWSLGGTVLGTDPTLAISLPLGTNRITLKVSDPCDASAETEVLVIVKDSTAPAILKTPAPLTLSAGCRGQSRVPNLIPGIVVEDSCTPTNQLVLSQTPPAGTMLGVGEYQVVITAKDAAGNCTKAYVPLKVVDTTPPAILFAPLFAFAKAGADGYGAVPNVLPCVVAVDNCTPPDKLKIEQVPAAGTLLKRGFYTIKVSATDASGNRSSREVFLFVTHSQSF